MLFFAQIFVIGKGDSMTKEEKYESAVRLLCDKHAELGRLPLKQDFEDNEVRFIKQKLGPWPRALEAASLKEVTGISSKEKSRKKRARKKDKRKNEFDK